MLGQGKNGGEAPALLQNLQHRLLDEPVSSIQGIPLAGSRAGLRSPFPARSLKAESWLTALVDVELLLVQRWIALHYNRPLGQFFHLG
jgi:hypothetical protein